jgi:hypothetical protein
MITFNNKTTLNSQPDIANENKVTASDMNEIKSVYNTEIGDISNLITTATNVVGAINELKENLGGKLLWTNSNPSSNFNSQDINLSSDDYDKLTIIYKTQTSENLCMSETIMKGQGALLHYIQGQTTGFVGNIRWREFNYVNDTKYSFGNGYNQVVTQQTATITNQNIIPLYIVGYKTGLFN